MTEENKYVLRHEWIDSNGKIYERINTDKIEYNEKIAELSNRIDKQTSVAERSLESQERQEKFQEALNENFEKFTDDFIDVKYKVQSHDEKIKDFQGAIEEKQKGNVHLTGIIIGGIFSVIVAAIGAAQLFF
ncbi:hypothetical protein HSZ49_09165 [Staphylococcus saprophyticus]|uniref:hypothetical protein n=1 Tax=Staphylococcus saprophyticus TaxID=29385 RepID=UPI00157CFAA2|nr:hypothetical protein [Staphylococcus saprophyticus]QKQ05989.1 hypothetical protein HSZ49_09165 [Staphylococcus saprophyticus]